MQQQADVVVIGAGFAGAATAYQLTRRGAGRVLVLEAEDAPGVHASGRNAGMARQVVEEPGFHQLGIEGVAYLNQLHTDEESAAIFRRTGSLLLASGTTVEALRRIAGPRAEWLTPDEAARRTSLVAQWRHEAALWTPDDGSVDIHGLLWHYLREARRRGAELQTGCRVEGITTAEGRVTGVETDRGFIAAGIVVNAAGAWAGDLGLRAGAASLPMTPYRRHLFQTGDLAWVRADGPFVWDVSHALYAKPESGALLLSACDQAAWAAGISPPVDEAVLEELALRTAATAPHLVEHLTIRRGWTGLRTITRDGEAVIGPDPQLSGLFWVAGLGGHGVTCSAAIGRVAADLILGQPVAGIAADRLSPARFV